MDSILEKEHVPFPQKSDRELLEDMQQRIIKIEKHARRNAIFAWGLALLLLLGLVLTVVSLVPQINVMKAQYDSVMETVQQMGNIVTSVDIQKLQDAADFVGSVDYEKLMELSDMLETLDAQQLKAQIDEITALVDKLGELNTEALVDNINLIIEKIQPVLNWFR